MIARANPVRSARAAFVLALGPAVFGGCAQNAAGPSARGAEAPAGGATSPVEEGVAILHSACGFVALVNDGAAHFTVELAGTAVAAKDAGKEGTFLTVDDLLVQVVHVSRAQIGDAAAGKSGVELLRAHERWESAYMGERIGTKLEVRELALEPGAAKALPGSGIVWWFPLPLSGGLGSGSWVFATVEVGERVVGLSAQATGGLLPVDVMRRLAAWLGTMKVSPAPLSAAAVSAALEADPRTSESCRAAVDATPTLGVDRRLRLDDIDEGAREAVVEVALANGGVERETVDARHRYMNHVCRFTFEYPGDGWTDFTVSDFSPRGCLLNLATPLVLDRDDGQKITNAVAIWATKGEADSDRDEFHERMLGTIQKKGGRVEKVSKPPLEGALGARYSADAGGTHFVGEVMTVRRGGMLYNVHFNSTRGSVSEGRKHLLEVLAGLRLDTP